MRRFYRCGYSADVSGGCGDAERRGRHLPAAISRAASCQQRGMLNADASGNPTTPVFGGFEFVPLGHHG